MNDRDVSIPELLFISKQLIESFFPSNDIYSLLVLALVTVTKYSREKRHLNSALRIELAITFIPDLIQYLKDEMVITEHIADKLIRKIHRRQKDLPLILQAYIYVAGGLRTKMESKLPEPSKKTCGIM